jgi:hypothetical protein
MHGDNYPKKLPFYGRFSALITRLGNAIRLIDLDRCSALDFDIGINIGKMRSSKVDIGLDQMEAKYRVRPPIESTGRQ